MLEKAEEAEPKAERKVEWLVLVILVLKKLRQGDRCKLGVSLDYIKNP